MAFLSLVTLKTDMEMDCDFDDFQVQAPDPEVVLKFLAEMEFRTMSARIANKLGVSAPEISSDRINNEDQITEAESISINTEKYELIDNVNDLNRWVTKIYQRGYVAVDTETTGLNDMIVDLVGICLSVEIGEACYIPVGHTNGEDDLFGGASLCNGQINLDEVLEILRPVLQDPSIIKIGQNVKYDTKIFARYDVNLAPVDDTMLLSYAINGGKHNHGMDYLSERYLNYKPISIKTLLGSGKSAITFDKVSINDAVNYAAEDADITLRLWKLFKPMLHESSVTKVYETLERPLIPVLAKMEMNGIKVDRNTLSRMSNNFAQSMSGLEAEIYNLAGQTFNVGSPKQLGEILFDKL